MEIIKGLICLGIMSGSQKSIFQSQEHKQFYMHGFGHWLGLDVRGPGGARERSHSGFVFPNMNRHLRARLRATASVPPKVSEVIVLYWDRGPGRHEVAHNGCGAEDFD